MPGTEFIGTQLLAEVEGNYDRRIEELTEKLNAVHALDDDQRHAAWRVSAVGRVRELNARIHRGEATDAELSHFSISSPPYPGDRKYEIEGLERQIDDLERTKQKAMAYVRALAAGPDGVVTVAAADLRRIGYAL